MEAEYSVPLTANGRICQPVEAVRAAIKAVIALHNQSNDAFNPSADWLLQASNWHPKANADERQSPHECGEVTNPACMEMCHEILFTLFCPPRQQPDHRS